MITEYDISQEKLVRITPKAYAQKELIQAMQIAFVRHMDEHSTGGMTKREKQIVWDQMDTQMSRVEKLFGYNPGSWSRGC